MTSRTSVRAYTALAFAMAIWGFSFLAVKDAVAILPIYTLLFLRFAIAAALLGGLVVIRGQARLPRRDLILLGVLSLLSPIGYFLFETHGVALTQASHVSLLVATIPIAVFLIAAARRTEAVTWKRIVGILGAFLGILLTIGASLHEEGASLFGDLLVLGAVVCAAVRTNLVKDVLKRVTPLQLTFYQFAFSLVVFAPLAGASGFSWTSQVTPLLVGEILFLGVFCSAAAFLAMHYSLAQLSVTQVAVAANLVPVITLLAEAALLGLAITPLKAAGTAVVILSVTLAQIGGRSPSDRLAVEEPHVG